MINKRHPANSRPTKLWKKVGSQRDSRVGPRHRWWRQQCQWICPPIACQNSPERTGGHRRHQEVLVDFNEHQKEQYTWICTKKVARKFPLPTTDAEMPLKINFSCVLLLRSLSGSLETGLVSRHVRIGSSWIPLEKWSSVIDHYRNSQTGTSDPAEIV